MTYQHPGDNPVPNMPAQLSASDLAWLTRLPADPTAITFEDGRVLAGMAAALPSGSADHRLVSSIWEPVKSVHDAAQDADTADTPGGNPMTSDTPTTTTDEILATLPDTVIVPSDRISTEESDSLISLFARALGAPAPTPEELAAERAERAGQPVTPRPGAQGKAQAARRFGPTATGPAPPGGPGAQGRAQAARRFPPKPSGGQ